MVTATYLVKGMTCGHCVNSVSAEVGAIPGVSGVTVDLGSGEVTVTSAEALDVQMVRAAVDQPGYDLVAA
jgi:copper chaperone CopZ